MSVSVNTRQIGTNLAFPDVCKIPGPLGIPVPTPLPNTAMRMQAIPGYFTVMIMNFPMLNLASSVPMTTGDEAGVYGGVISQTFKGPVQWVVGSTAVFVGGPGLTRLIDQTTHNTGNVAGGTGLDPSQTIYLVMI